MRLEHHGQGTLYFFNNTVISTRAGNTTLFRLSTNDEAADARNNIFYVTESGSSLALLGADGQLSLSHNWLSAGYVSCHGTLTGSVLDDGTNLTGSDPGFEGFGSGDYHLAAGSQCIDAGGALAAAAAPDHAVLSQFIDPRGSEPRPLEPPLDLGAFERCVSGSCGGSDPDGGLPADGGLVGDGGAGSDGGSTPDGGATSDGGATPDPKGDSGCGCASAGRGAPCGPLAVLLLWLLAPRLSRRRFG
ncbi:MAG: hypothetical protein RBU30_25335 [Polyangia bacterium]|jgi:hypothetical protein|nr:hypothetical protein [Polyangia bacterium]